MSALGKIWLSLALLSVLGASFPLPSGLATDSEESPGRQASLTVLNYATGWSHDAVGYHPAIYLLAENTSGHDLSNKFIRFQARFTDLQTAELSVGRKDQRKPLKPHQQIFISIEGSRGYELPFEVHQWPSIECKVMCRVGNVGDEGTETLLIARLESVTKTAEEAFEQLNQTSGFDASIHRPRPPALSSPASATPSFSCPRPKVEKPLLATAEKLLLPRGKTRPDYPVTTISLLGSKSLPGLGDDFWDFEQRFGLPQATDTRLPDWTFARYKHAASGAEIIAGSREHGGKVDLLMLKVSRSDGTSEIALVNAARSLSGKFKTQSLSQPMRSVRYLSSGRVELVNASAPGYKVVVLAPSHAEESDNSFILALSRLPQDIEPLLATLCQKSPLLKPLKFLEKKDSD